ncbi:hypothetical protein [Nostoc sp. PA-18-2419]|uniref:hypothetical protein n=1 Tax=Nostoc sp. PA-18-2419 TaxID=2575443 RepID=UPI001109419E|nr:hypothetical protein [Nostoc sp. PA-18-2419]
MTITPDLTFQQIHAKCSNAEIAEYIACMKVLPINVSMCQFLATFLQACAIAQIAANAESNAANGERLNTYPLPTMDTVKINTEANFQFFASTYKLNVITEVGKGYIVPVYV